MPEDDSQTSIVSPMAKWASFFFMGMAAYYFIGLVVSEELDRFNKRNAGILEEIIENAPASNRNMDGHRPAGRKLDSSLQVDNPVNTAQQN